jgi:hypothetical protein
MSDKIPPGIRASIDRDLDAFIAAKPDLGALITADVRAAVYVALEPLLALDGDWTTRRPGNGTDPVPAPAVNAMVASFNAEKHQFLLDLLSERTSREVVIAIGEDQRQKAWLASLPADIPKQ